MGTVFLRLPFVLKYTLTALVPPHTATDSLGTFTFFPLGFFIFYLFGEERQGM